MQVVVGRSPYDGDVAVSQALVDEACDGLGVSEVSLIADGGQKTVRLVEREGSRHVLKVIEIGKTSPESLQRAAREVSLLQSISSPHVVRAESDLVELGDPPSGAAWLEELLDGDDLTAHFGQEWTWPDAARMMMEICLGLAEMHDARVVHRDLSPANIRRRASGQYVVMDPGYARHELLSPITVFGHPGTYGYISPEHLLQPPNGPTAFSDVFCVAILGQQALSGEVPIPYSGDLNDYATRLRDGTRADLRAVRSDLGAGVLDIFDRALHRQPARRFAHARQMVEAIEGLT